MAIHFNVTFFLEEWVWLIQRGDFFFFPKEGFRTNHCFADNIMKCQRVWNIYITMGKRKYTDSDTWKLYEKKDREKKGFYQFWQMSDEYKKKRKGWLQRKLGSLAPPAGWMFRRKSGPWIERAVNCLRVALYLTRPYNFNGGKKEERGRTFPVQSRCYDVHLNLEKVFSSRWRFTCLLIDN